VADVAKTESDNEASTNALNGTATLLAMDNLVSVLDKVRLVPMVETSKATEQFLKAQELFESIKTQYLGVTEKETINA
jgi:hypothetical protein